VLVSSQSAAVAAAGLLIALIAVADQRTSPSFGLLYLFPIILIGTTSSRVPIALAAAGCAWLTALFNRLPLSPGAMAAQDALVFTALAGTGLVAHELAKSRRREMAHSQAVQREADARHAAEEQLAAVIDTSPAAILVATSAGEVLLANAAAHRVFDVRDGTLAGRKVGRYVPALASVGAGRSGAPFHTEMECRGQRENGTTFPATVFFSTYATALGDRLAAMVVDTSADRLEREESNLEQLMAGSRAFVSAVTHEVRNLCGAVAVVHENLARSGKLRDDRDFEALGTLVGALTRIASVQLKQRSGQPRTEAVDLTEVLDDLRLVIDPYCDNAGIAVRWGFDAFPAEPVMVSVDRQHLLQALLNLIRNSGRALERADVKEVEVAVAVRGDVVSIRVSDTGPGPASIDYLFQPFQRGAACTGLGLFIARALVRSFRGDLRYDPNPGCSFVIDVPVAVHATGAIKGSIYDTHSIAAR